jgi:hypothetical protein
MEALGNIYENGSQTCHLKGKTYRNAQLGEIVHSVAVEHALKHEVVYGSEPTWEKYGEGETVVERQPPRTSGVTPHVSNPHDYVNHMFKRP